MQIQFAELIVGPDSNLLDFPLHTCLRNNSYTTKGGMPFFQKPENALKRAQGMPGKT